MTDRTGRERERDGERDQEMRARNGGVEREIERDGQREEGAEKERQREG